jgi:hypothetical protein
MPANVNANGTRQFIVVVQVTRSQDASGQGLNSRFALVKDGQTAHHAQELALIDFVTRSGQGIKPVHCYASLARFNHNESQKLQKVTL